MNAPKIARLRLVADGLRRIQEFESARYLDEYADFLSERQAAMQRQGGEAIELPDNIRVPLDEVIADLRYLFGRVAADGSFMKAAMDSTRLKLESARNAIVATLQPPQPVRSVSEEDVKDAERYRWLRNDPPLELAVRRKNPNPLHGDCAFTYLDADTLDQAIDAAPSAPEGDGGAA